MVYWLWMSLTGVRWAILPGSKRYTLEPDGGRELAVRGSRFTVAAGSHISPIGPIRGHRSPFPITENGEL